MMNYSVDDSKHNFRGAKTLVGYLGVLVTILVVGSIGYIFYDAMRSSTVVGSGR